MSETPQAVALVEEVQRAIAARSTQEEASAILTRSRELGFNSDWDLWMGSVTERPFDFACLVVAVAHLLPPRGFDRNRSISGRHVCPTHPVRRSRSFPRCHRSIWPTLAILRTNSWL
jgi:hypothetical protein